MNIFNQSGSFFVNSDRIDCFSVEEKDSKFYLFADNYELGEFDTMASAKQELDKISCSIGIGQHSYQV